MRNVIIACAVLGIVTVAATLAVGHRTFGSPRATAEYGRRLMTQTPRYLAQYMGNRLSCASCHIHAGGEPRALSLISAVDQPHGKPSRTASTIAWSAVNLNCHPAPRRRGDGRHDCVAAVPG